MMSQCGVEIQDELLYFLSSCIVLFILLISSFCTFSCLIYHIPLNTLVVTVSPSHGLRVGCFRPEPATPSSTQQLRPTSAEEDSTVRL